MSEQSWPHSEYHHLEKEWQACPQEGLVAYVLQWADEIENVCEPKDRHWIYVPALPLKFTGTMASWHDWWKEQVAEAEDNGGDRWSHLLEEDICQPVVMGLHAPEDDNGVFDIWDSNHRMGAARLTKRTMPAVIGVAPNLRLEHLPEELHSIPAFQAYFAALTHQNKPAVHKVSAIINKPSP